MTPTVGPAGVSEERLAQIVEWFDCDWSDVKTHLDGKYAEVWFTKEEESEIGAALRELLAARQQLAELQRENIALRNLANNLQPGPISEALAGTRYTREAELVQQLAEMRVDLDRAEDAAKKGEIARQTAGGMEMEIDELRDALRRVDSAICRMALPATRDLRDTIDAALAPASQPERQGAEDDDGADTGNAEADRVLRRLASSDPDFDDCIAAAVLIRRLVADMRGPDGFATWKDAAIAERMKRPSPPQDDIVAGLRREADIGLSLATGMGIGMQGGTTEGEMRAHMASMAHALYRAIAALGGEKGWQLTDEQREALQEAACYFEYRRLSFRDGSEHEKRFAARANAIRSIRDGQR